MEKQAKNLTKDQKILEQENELRNLRDAQKAELDNPDKADLIPANRDSNYKIRTIEANYVHVWTREKHHDAANKQYVDSDRVVIIHAREFDRRIQEGAFTVYDEVRVIHDPRANAPKTDAEYGFKKDQLDVKATGNDADVKLKNPNVAQREKQLANKEDAINQKAADLDAREKALAEREAESKKK